LERGIAWKKRECVSRTDVHKEKRSEIGGTCDEGAGLGPEKEKPAYKKVRKFLKEGGEGEQIYHLSI